MRPKAGAVLWNWVGGQKMQLAGANEVCLLNSIRRQGFSAVPDYASWLP